MYSSLTSAFLTLALSTSLVTAGGFFESCKDFHLSYGSTQLTATCGTGKAGVYKTTTLDLNKCIANQDGIPVYRSNGDFGKTCNSEQLIHGSGEKGLTLFMNCAQPNGVYKVNMAIDLDKGITNRGGTLSC